jgi:hypothetical protein
MANEAATAGGPHAAVSVVDASSAKPDAAGGVPAVKAAAQESSLAASLPIITFWISMSCAVILFNKYLYMGTFKHPLTLTAIHMGFATAATSALKAAGYIVVPPSVQQGWRFWARNVLPIGLLFAASLGTSNLAAVRLTVSFIQMVKALTPMLALAISVAMKLEVATRTLVAGACAARAIARGGRARHPCRPFCNFCAHAHSRTSARTPLLAPAPRARSPPRPRSGQHHVRGRHDRLLRRD